MDTETPSRFPLTILIVLSVGVLAYLAWVFVAASDQGTVAGSVSFEQKPLTNATVVFLGLDPAHAAPVISQSDDQGNYRLAGNTGSGIKIGKYKVTITKVALKDGSIPKGEKLIQAQNQGLLINQLPKIYEDRATTPIEVTVSSGTNTIPLVVKK